MPQQRKTGFRAPLLTLVSAGRSHEVRPTSSRRAVLVRGIRVKIQQAAQGQYDITRGVSLCFFAHQRFSCSLAT